MILFIVKNVVAGFFAGFGGFLFDQTKKNFVDEPMPCKICGGDCYLEQGVCERCFEEHLKNIGEDK